MRGSTVSAASDPRVGVAAATLMRREVLRKLLHLCAVAVPLFVWYAPHPVAIAVTISAAALALATEALRSRNRAVRRHFLLQTRRLLRRHERRQLTGATYLAVSFAVALLVFPHPVAVLAMLYSGLGDAVAGIAGRIFGRHRLASGKSWEGSAALLAVAVLAGVLLPGIPLVAAVVGGIAAAALELASLPPDDNVWVTIGGGAVVVGAMSLVG